VERALSVHRRRGCQIADLNGVQDPASSPLANNQMRQAGATDHEAHEAAVAAVQTVLSLPWKEASAEAVNAIAYATRYHSDWFWKGAQHIRKWRGTVH
jgi:hypothetical protein